MVTVAHVVVAPPLSVHSEVVTSPMIAPLSKWSASKTCWFAEASTSVVSLLDGELLQPAMTMARQALVIKNVLLFMEPLSLELVGSCQYILFRMGNGILFR